MIFSQIKPDQFFYRYEEGRGGGGSLKDLVGDHLISGATEGESAEYIKRRM